MTSLAVAFPQLAGYHPRRHPTEFMMTDITRIDNDQGEPPVVRPPQPVRAGWAEAFAEMAARGDDQLLDPQVPPSEFDLGEWQW